MMFKPLSVKRPGQKNFVRTLVENDIILLDGIFGTGKTYLTMGIACEWLVKEKIDKIVIARPIVGCDNEIGALPGELGDKIKPYFAQHTQYFLEFLGKDLFLKFLGTNKIEMVPVEVIRSRSYDNTFMIVDEAQNCTKRQFMLSLTRVGDKSKIVFVGDHRQSDIGDYPFFEAILRAKDRLQFCKICELTEQDFFRNTNALACYKELSSL